MAPLTDWTFADCAESTAERNVGIARCEIIAEWPSLLGAVSVVTSVIFPFVMVTETWTLPQRVRYDVPV